MTNLLPINLPINLLPTTSLLFNSILIVLLSLLIRKLFNQWQLQSSLNTPGIVPAPPNHHWFFGQLVDLFPPNNRKSTILFMKKFKEYAEKTRNHSKFYKLDFFNPLSPFGRSILIATHVDVVREMLNPQGEVHFIKGNSYRVAAPLIGNGILSSPTQSDGWKSHRKLIERGFRLDNLKKSPSRINKVVSRTVNRWNNDPAFHSFFDMREEMLRLTMDVICQVGFGKDYEELHREEIPGNQPLYSIINSIIVTMSQTANRPPFITTLEKYFSRDKEVVEYWRKFDVLKQVFMKLIDERLSILSNPSKRHVLQDSNDWSDLKPGSNSGTLIDSIVDLDDSGNPIMSKQLMLDEIQTLVFAGHDTTGNTLAWSLYELSTHPTILLKLEKEILEVCGEIDEPEYGNLDAKMPFLNAFIKEILRLHPPAGFTRMTIEPCKLAGVNIPKDVDIMIFPLLLHLDFRYFDFPMELIPERWLPNSNLKSEEKAYFPFSLNQRNCVGMKLAQLELRIVLIRLIQEFEFENDGRVPVDYLSMTLNPDKVGMKVWKRSRKLGHDM